MAHVLQGKPKTTIDNWVLALQSVPPLVISASLQVPRAKCWSSYYRQTRGSILEEALISVSNLNCSAFASVSGVCQACGSKQHSFSDEMKDS